MSSSDRGVAGLFPKGLAPESRATCTTPRPRCSPTELPTHPRWSSRRAYTQLEYRSKQSATFICAGAAPSAPREVDRPPLETTRDLRKARASPAKSTDGTVAALRAARIDWRQVRGVTASTHVAASRAPAVRRRAALAVASPLVFPQTIHFN